MESRGSGGIVLVSNLSQANTNGHSSAKSWNQNRESVFFGSGSSIHWLLASVVAVLYKNLMDFGGLFGPRREETIHNSRAQKPSALPMGNNIMRVAGGATHHLHGVIWHINNTLRNVGARNIQTGIGSGVGFGHGSGVGLAVKPGMVQKIQACFVQVMAKMMIKLGIFPSLSISQGILPKSLQGSNESIQNLIGNVTTLPDNKLRQMLKSANLDPFSTYGHPASESNLVDSSFASQTEKILGSSLHNPFPQKDNTSRNDATGHLQSANHILQMVLKHQEVIEELVEENKKLRQILVEDLKISPSKLQK